MTANALPAAVTDLDAGSVAVYRAARVTGDTKTPESRRLPQLAVQAFREHHRLQAWTLGCLTYKGKSWDPGGA